jgi:hypothetical protein
VVQVIVAEEFVIPLDVTAEITGGPAGTAAAGCCEVVKLKLDEVEVPAELPELTAKL